MEGMIRAVSEHPVVATTVCFVLLIAVYFLLKGLVKLLLVALIVLVAVGGYWYFQYPESRPADLGDAVEKARDAAVGAVDRGREIYEKGRELLDRGKAILDQGVDRGKETVEKGRDAAAGLKERPGAADGNDGRRREKTVK